MKSVMLLLTFALGTSVFSIGQAVSGCGIVDVIGSYNCSTDSCEDSAPIDYLDPCSGGDICPTADLVEYNCCGTTRYYSVPTDRGCPYAALTDPETRHALLALASSSDILVADCGGTYQPIKLAAEQSATPHRLQRLDKVFTNADRLTLWR